MDTNQIAAMVQGGKADVLALWAAVRRFTHDRAYRWERVLGSRCGVTIDDLMQTGFLALLDALEGYDITYPVVFDWETIGSSNARTNDIDNQTLTDCAIAFCERVAEEGYIPMVYFNLAVGYMKYDLSQLTDYDFWFAQYPASDSMYPTMYYHYDIWQYTSSGSVPGIDGDVDMNIAWRRW